MSKTVKRNLGKKTLPVKLNEDEMLKAGDELAQAEIELQDAIATAKSTAATFREERRAIQEKIDGLAKTIQEGESMQEIECYEELDFDTKKVQLIRKDTKEVVSVRDADPGELQGTLFAEKIGN